MKNVKVSGFILRFDWGTMEHIARATGLDAANPLEGLKVVDQAPAILYGALCRVDERAEQPETYTIDDCKKMIKDFSGGQIKKLVNAYIESLKIDVDEEAEPGEVLQEVKKNQ